MGADEALSCMADVMSVIVSWGHDTSTLLGEAGTTPSDESVRTTFSQSLDALQRHIRPILQDVRSAMGEARQGASLMQSVLDDMLRMQALRKGHVELSHALAAPSEVLLDALAAVQPRADAARVTVNCAILALADKGAGIGLSPRGRGHGSDSSPSASSSSRSALNRPLSLISWRAAAARDSSHTPPAKTRLRVLSRTEDRIAGWRRQPPAQAHTPARQA